MKTLVLTLGAATVLHVVPSPSPGQQAPPERLPASLLDVVAPSEWVRGAPGEMRVITRECRSVPADVLRRRIVDVAVQEWAFFGFPVLDRLNGARLLPPGSGSTRAPLVFENTTRRGPPLNAREGERVAASIGGYWAVTPEGADIVQQQNRVWNRRGLGARWNAPWSAAFVSWVMCEAGIGTNDGFRRAIAHWTYIDQAIRARDGQEPAAAFEAFDIGERAIQPGDLLCAGRRPRYSSIAERRRQMGAGARSHCDIVVAIDEPGERILAIGGNVLRSVSLKVLPAERAPGGGLVPRSTRRARLFAHLQLRAAPVGENALADSPVLAAYTCPNGGATSSRATFVLTELGVASVWSGADGSACASVSTEETGNRQGGGAGLPNSPSTPYSGRSRVR